jgi:hypothetical protein
VLVYTCSLKNDATLYMHNCRLKITLPPPPLYHLHHLTTAETILHHPATPHYKHLTNNWPSDTILHHLHHLTTDGYIGHICTYVYTSVLMRHPNKYGMLISTPKWGTWDTKIRYANFWRLPNSLCGEFLRLHDIFQNDRKFVHRFYIM